MVDYKAEYEKLQTRLKEAEEAMLPWNDERDIDVDDLLSSSKKQEVYYKKYDL